MTTYRTRWINGRIKKYTRMYRKSTIHVRTLHFPILSPLVNLRLQWSWILWKIQYSKCNNMIKWMLISFEPLTRQSYLFNRACNRIPPPPPPISIHTRFVRRIFFLCFFINANCSKTKAESFIQWQPVAWQQSTFTILWSLEGIKSNYRSGFSIVRNESLYTFTNCSLVPRQRIPETVPSFRGRLYNPFHSSSWKNLFQLLRGVIYFNFRSLLLRDLKIFSR